MSAVGKKVLVAEPLSKTGLEVLAKSGLVADVRPALSRADLLVAVADADALVVRSATQVDRDLLSAGKKLRVVGRAGVGLDNVDVKAATELGILVVNAPSGNVVSAAEHTVALLLSLLRKIPEAQVSLKAGEWKRTKFVGTELSGKTVGVVGLGQVGARVAARLRPWDVKLLGFDPFVSVERAKEMGVILASLDDVLAKSDIVTLHTPVTAETRGMISADRLSRMKKGALLVNCARGALVDEAALLAALDSGQVGGAAIDVFSVEPPKDFTLARHPKVVCTPHLGASTVEAQDRVAVETVEMLVQALAGSPFVAAVNLPFPPGGDPHASLPWMRLAERLGAFAIQLLPEAPTRIGVTLAGVPAPFRKAVSVAAVKGVLTPKLAEAVNLVNASAQARLLGIAVSETESEETGGYANLVTVTVGSASIEQSVAGTLFGERYARVVSVGGLAMECTPEGTLVFLENRDVPGVVGRIGTLLGSKGINIADFKLSRAAKGRAAAVVRIDRPEGRPPEPEIVDALSNLEGVETVRVVALS